MSNVNAGWYGEGQKAVVIVFAGRWSWEEFDEGFAEVARLVGSVGYDVALIVDSAKGPTPPDPRVLGHFQNSWRIIPKNVGMMILLGANAFMEGMSKVFATAVATRIKFRTARTYEDADRILAEPPPES